ncbi:MAG: dihydroorotate dehydrogenase-like protein [Acidimicrobiales bacterium]|nr:dihydroorotate dehydrogenase-like protein [Acidimicrobiales bacterium]
MVDLSTEWLGLSLRSPLVVGASPLCDTVEHAQALVEAGAGAVVLASIFEEQLVADQVAAHHFFDSHVDTDAEAPSFLADTEVFAVSADPVLRRVTKLADQLDVPVIGSINGVTPGGWTTFAQELADAGAAAIELNLYDIATDVDTSGAHLEERQLQVVASVASTVDVPVSVKLSPSYASVPNMVARLSDAGAAGVVLFNRYYQPDIDLETLDADRTLHLSTSAELPQRLHALAALHHRVTVSLASSGGVHAGTDAAKAILCGAHAVQLVSALLAGGPDALRRIGLELRDWLDEQGYRTLDEARGATSLDNVANPHEWERLNYAHLLAGWHGRPGRP